MSLRGAGRRSNLNPTIFYFLFSIFLAFLILPNESHAGFQLLPKCVVENRLCQLNDIVQTFLNFARILMGLVGTAVLFFFVYGGFVWLTSGGAADRIKKGKDIVVNSIIGLVIVFGAFTIIEFVFRAFGAKPVVQIGQPCDERGKKGLLVPDPKNPSLPPKCATSCDEPRLKDAGYSCQDASKGTNCLSGLCPGGVNNLCCQSATPPKP